MDKVRDDVKWGVSRRHFTSRGWVIFESTSGILALKRADEGSGLKQQDISRVRLLEQENIQLRVWSGKTAADCFL